MTEDSAHLIPSSLKRLPSSALEWATWAAYLADSKKALDIQVLKTEDVTTLADYFVICTGQSKPQARAIAEEIAYVFRHAGNTAIGDERDVANTWCLLDFTDVVIHVMQAEARDFYSLEKFWNHAELVPAQAWHQVAEDLGLLTLEVESSSSSSFE
ncbi:MAG: ribosome silencing factor [Vampirovibrio sp.]